MESRSCPRCESPLPPEDSQLCPHCAAGMLLSLPAAEDQDSPLADNDISGEGFPFSIRGYDIHAFVGRGGMGKVYRATRTSDHLEVAIKILSGLWLDSAAVKDRFRQEVELSSAIGDPRTVNVIESGLDQDTLVFYYVMEFIDGVPIDRFVRSKQLSEAEILSLVIDLCEAISGTHQIGIIHRDLKPENILVTKEAEIKILDFGLAKFIDSEQKTNAHTIGQIIGTPGYMAPEVTDLSCPPNVQLDVFSLGVILSNLLGADHDQASNSVKLPPLSQDLESICLKAIEPSTSDRYRSVDALTTDLHAYQNGNPVTARPLTRWNHLKRLIRNHPMTFAASAAATLAIIALAIGMTFYGIRESRAKVELQTQAETQRKQMVQLLLTCDPANLDGIYQTLAPRAKELRSLLAEHDAPSRNNPTRQARIDALLSQLEPERLNGLKGVLSRMKNLHEVRFIARLLLPYRDEFSADFWDYLINNTRNDNFRLAQATALAVWDPDNTESWKKISQDIATRCSHRANQKGIVDDAIAAFYPVRQHLRPHFAFVFQGFPTNPYTAALYAGMLDLELQEKIENLLVSDESFRLGIDSLRDHREEALTTFKALQHFRYRWIGDEGYGPYTRCVAGELIFGGTEAQAWGRLRPGFRGRTALIENLRHLGVSDDLLVQRLKLALAEIESDPPSDKTVGLAAALIQILASPPPTNPEHLAFFEKTRDSILSRQGTFGKNEPKLRQALGILN